MLEEDYVFAKNLSCWSGPVEPTPLAGGITNSNFLVEDGGKKYVVRIGGDIPVHGVMRFNELNASRAACAAGVSPGIFHHESGAFVLEFIESKTLDPETIRDPDVLDQIIPLLKKIHHDIPEYLQGPSLSFWVFQVLRDYRRTLRLDNSRMVSYLPQLEESADNLEQAVGPVQMVFGHNDLLAANFLDDGTRLWVIDWDYAGFNSPLFDLANLASNNAFDADLECHMLESYFGTSTDEKLWKSYNAMKCASLLREAMWSMVSESRSSLDFDYVAYTDDNLKSFEKTYEEFLKI